jgi:hypothetical protein
MVFFPNVVRDAGASSVMLALLTEADLMKKPSDRPTLIAMDAVGHQTLVGPVDWKSLGSSFRSSPVAKAVTMCGGAAIIVVALCRTTANVSNGAVSQINRRFSCTNIAS